MSEDTNTWKTVHVWKELPVYGDGKHENRKHNTVWFRNGYPLQCSCLENSIDGEPDGLQSMALQ